MTVIAFAMSGLPRGQGRPRATVRRGGFASVYKASKDRTYEGSVAKIARDQMGKAPPLTGPLSASFRFRLPIPKGAKPPVREAMVAGEIAHVFKPDLSNMVKAIEDAMNGIVFIDDAQIVRCFTTKIYSERPGVDVRVEALEPQGEQP